MNTLNYAHHSPESRKALMMLEGSLRESPLEKSLIDLVKIRASQINGCLFCLDMHVKEAHLHGERELRLHHLSAWRESPLFTDKEKAALAWTETVTRIADGVSEQDLKDVLAHFSEKEVSDLTFAVIAINAWNRLGIAFHGVPGSLDKAGLG